LLAAAERNCDYRSEKVMSNRDLLERIAQEVPPPGFPDLIERRNHKAKRARIVARVVGLTLTALIFASVYVAMTLRDHREPFLGAAPSDIDGRIAFAVKEADGWHVGTVNADGTGRQILTSGVRDYGTSWSPDGTKIAYDTDNRGIWIMNADGSDKRRLTTGADSFPRWSPDGSRILFSRYGNEMFKADAYTSYSTSHLWVVNVDGTHERQLTDSKSADLAGSWSPDGTEIAFLRSDGDGSGVWVIDADGTGLRKVVGFGFQLDGSAAWSPDGTRIVYAIAGYSGGNSDPRIWMVNADGSGAHMVLDEWAQDPTWSPDGSLIAYTSGGDIWVVDVDGKGARRVTSDSAEEIQPSWGHSPTPTP
jgi:Tol biopolymer transport system component